MLTKRRICIVCMFMLLFVRGSKTQRAQPLAKLQNTPFSAAFYCCFFAANFRFPVKCSPFACFACIFITFECLCIIHV